MIISSNISFGQDTSKSEKGFGLVNIGIGGGSEGISTGINASYQNNNSIISIRYIYNEEFIVLFSSHKYKIRDLGILYGLSVKKPKGFASISAGISYVGYNGRGSVISCSGNWLLSSCTYEELNYSTIGIPIETQLFLTRKRVGIGIYGFANLNKVNSFTGALLCMHIVIWNN